jgi:hypothetical protein
MEAKNAKGNAKLQKREFETENNDNNYLIQDFALLEVFCDLFPPQSQWVFVVCIFTLMLGVDKVRF